LRASIRIIGSIVLAFLILACRPVIAGAAQRNEKVIITIIDRVTFDDFEGLPNINRLISNGAIAVMNNRASGTAGPCKSYVSIGSGARAEGTPSAVTAVEAGPGNTEVFYRRTGIEVSEGCVINPEIIRLINQNAKGEYQAVAGNLGHCLRGSGLKTAIFGNGDHYNGQVRWAISIAMDRNGIVDFGKVADDVLTEDRLFPTGRRTDFNSIFEHMSSVVDQADLIVIETGDMTRVEESKDLLSQDMYAIHRQNSLRGIDTFLGRLTDMVHSNGWMLMLITPYPSADSIAAGDRLTPVIIYGGGFKPGLLTSATTRREGIIANVDIAPTVLAYFDITADGMVGTPLKGLYRENNLEAVKQVNRATVNTSNFRYPVLSNYAICVIIIILLSLMSILYPDLLKRRLAGAMMFLILSAMSVPLVLLILPSIGHRSLILTAVLIIAGSVMLSMALHLFVWQTTTRIFVISAVTTAALIIDLLSGGSLIRGSLLGYDPIIGARYYGIGNEYMGIIIGSTVIALASLNEDRQLALLSAMAVLGIVFTVVGYPGLGANVGGAVTCFVTFAFYLLRLKGIRVRIRHALAVAAGLAFVILCFVIVDILLLKDQTHLGSAVKQALNMGPMYAVGIINRKVAMNLKLLRYTIWTKVLVTVIVATGILFYRPVGIFQRVFSRHPGYTKGWSALVVAAAVGMAVNDSGVVTSATCSIFFIMSMLIIFLEERNTKGRSRVLPIDEHGI
jgi:hypothetical protein